MILLFLSETRQFIEESLSKDNLSERQFTETTVSIHQISIKPSRGVLNAHINWNVFL